MPDEDTEVVVDTSTTVEEAPESNENSEQEDTVDLAEVEALKTAKAQLTARAKKAEEELKLLKANHPVNSDPQFSDELKLIARGLSDEEIDFAKVIAKGKDLPLQKAILEDSFLSYQATLKEKKRKEDAKLGASKGSGESRDDTLIKEGMSREEHEKAFKKVMGQ